jgi:hypothetical protein
VVFTLELAYCRHPVEVGSNFRWCSGHRALDAGKWNRARSGSHAAVRVLKARKSFSTSRWLRRNGTFLL